MARIVVAILLLQVSLSAQTRTFCRPDGTGVELSERFTPRKAAGWLFDYYNYATYPPNPLQTLSLQDGLKFLGFPNLTAFQEKFGLPPNGQLNYPTLGMLINKLNDAQELFSADAECPEASPLESQPRLSISLPESRLESTPEPLPSLPECRRGLTRVNEDCVPFDIPENASLDLAGHGWVCRMGFVAVRNSCVAVRVPEHARMNFSGNGWICQRGFIKNDDSCVPVVLPVNASLNLSGTGWVCHRGYVPEGNSCTVVAVPENATLNLSGNGWVCRLGFFRVDGNCTKRTSLLLASTNQ